VAKLLRVENLIAHLGAAQLLFDIDFEANAGEVTVLVGRNGAGKSTIMKSIMGLIDGARGVVEFDGRNVMGATPHDIARLGIGYVPEERRIFTDLTVAENLEVGRQPARANVADPPKLAEMLDRPAGHMSGGEQQMLTIARTLMGNPRVILLDEPSEGLAPIVVQRIAETVRELKREGLCVILSEQNLHFARAVADRAVVIERGVVRFAGSFAALEADERVRSEFLTA
jgi:branched-chain amino acid transport system ATP-binding protein